MKLSIYFSIKMSSIFDILNLSNIFLKKMPELPPPDLLDTSKRHYLCVEKEDRTSCNRIYTKPIASGNHVTISQAYPEFFDGITLSYKLGKNVYKS